MPKVDIVIPTIRDDEFMKPMLESIEKNTPKESYNIILVRGMKYAQAINHYYNNLRTGAEYMVIGSDDLVFHPNWFEEAVKSGADVVGPNDLHNPMVMNGQTATHFVVKMSYLDEKGGTFDGSFPVMFEYNHNFCDTEFVTVAKYRGCFQYVPECVIEHNHPIWSGRKKDKVDEKNQSLIKIDEKTYYDRMDLFEKWITHEKKVFIAIPTMGTVHTHLARNLLAWSPGNAVFMTFGTTPVEHARNEIVKEFLKTDCTHLWMIDDDTIPPVSAIFKMLCADKDIVSGLTVILRQKGSFYNVTTHVEGNKAFPAKKDTGLVKAYRFGTSCVMIKREVFDKVPFPWFKFNWNDGHTHYDSEDIYFADTCRKLGIQAYAHTEVVCKHAKMVTV